MWIDYFLKAPDRASFEAACPWLGDDGHVVPDGPTHAMVIVGQLAYGAQFDAEGNLTVAPTIIPGWHVNVRMREGVALPISLAAFQMIPPAYPKMVFAD